MGYFSQKKKRQRENMFLVISLIIWGFLVLSSFFADRIFFSSLIKDCLFQIYIFNIFVFLFALFHKKIVFSILSLLLLLVSYTHISSSANIFINTKVDNAANTLKLKYSNHPQAAFFEPQSQMQATGYGKVGLSPRFSGLYTTYKSNDGYILTLLRVDFSGLKDEEQKDVFANLAEFVAQRNEPLIIYGDFGIPSWQPQFKTFLHQTSLEVKNRIILNNLESKMTIFNIPTINLVAYNNVGISQIKTIPAKGKESEQLEFTIQYFNK